MGETKEEDKCALVTGSMDKDLVPFEALSIFSLSIHRFFVHEVEKEEHCEHAMLFGVLFKAGNAL